MNSPSTTTQTPSPPPPGQPRSDEAALRLERYEGLARIPIILSALLPLLIVPEPGHPVSVAIGIATWLVFVIDLVAHQRFIQGYLGTRLGRFDLAIVVLTAPWFLLPGAGAGSLVVVLRLARLARLAVASRGAKQLFARLGRVAAVAASIMAVCAFVVFLAERPTNPEFASFGDALWWSVVTLTTVGYGDIVPVTMTGRLGAAALMITGIALLGLLAGALASFLGLAQDETTTPVPDSASTTGATLDEVLDELRALRARVEALDPDRS